MQPRAFLNQVEYYAVATLSAHQMPTESHLSEAEISMFLFLLKSTNLVTVSITHCTSTIRSPCRYEDDNSQVTQATHTYKYAVYVCMYMYRCTHYVHPNQLGVVYCLYTTEGAVTREQTRVPSSDITTFTFACGPSTGILTMMNPSLPEVTVREGTSV